MRIEDVHSYFWSPHSAVLQIGRKGRLWRVDPAQPPEDNWRYITPRGFKGWSIQSSPQTSDDLLVIASSDRNPAFSDLYTTRQDGSEKTLFIKNEGQTVGWVLGQDLTALNYALTGLKTIKPCSGSRGMVSGQI
jgi:hypothetical protein